MIKILTLDIQLCRGRTSARSWSAQVEVPDALTLCELHSTIQELVDFDDDHLHEFFAGRSWRDRRPSFSEPDLDFGEDVPLSRVFPLPKGQKLYYHFDFGDNWLFEIARRLKRKQADGANNVVTLIREKGRRPIQYPDEDDEG